MTRLAIASLIVGAVIAAWNAPGLYAPDKVAAWLRLFPRDRKIGCVLMFINMAWTVWIVHTGQYGDLTFELRRLGITIFIPEQAIRYSVFVLGPLFFFAVIYYANQYLAARGVGILLILAARPLLAAAFIEDSASRLVITVLAYVWVIFGIVFVAAPHRMRDLIAWNTHTIERFRLLCAVRLGFGVLLVLLAFAVY
jgi:hypothetical protein